MSEENSLFRATKMSGKWYAIEINELSEGSGEVDNILDLLSGGDIVILGDSVESIAKALEIEIGDIEIVQPDEEEWEEDEDE